MLRTVEFGVSKMKTYEISCNSRTYLEHRMGNHTLVSRNAAEPKKREEGSKETEEESFSFLLRPLDLSSLSLFFFNRNAPSPSVSTLFEGAPPAFNELRFGQSCSVVDVAVNSQNCTVSGWLSGLVRLANQAPCNSSLDVRHTAGQKV